MASYDLTVYGAGVFGLSIAWTAALRGARVQVIDPNGPAAGSSGGLVGALAPHVPENWNPKKAFQLDSLLMAEAFWARVATEGGGTPGYLRSGRLQPIADAHALTLAEARADTAKTLWQGKATWQIVPTDTDPWTPNSPSSHLIHDTLSALIHPRMACDALVRALGARNVPIQREATPSGKVVWATGVDGLDALNKTQTRSMGSGVKGQAALLDVNAIGKPQLFVSGVHIIPHANGTVAVGSTSERTYEDRSSTDCQLDAVIETARASVPALRDAPVLDRWAGVRPRSRSRAPMLGHWPDRPDHFIANGGFKIGFGMAPKMADVMADLVLDGHDAIPQGFRVEDNF